MAFSADGLHVATYGKDLTLRTWDARSGQPLSVLRTVDPANHIALSPDGQRIITDSREGIPKIYPTTTEAYFHTACNLLRYRPEFAQVQAECQSQLDPEPPLQ